MAVIPGTPGNDDLTGLATEDNDNISGEAGNDTLSGLGGEDFIDGGAGDDSISGGDGNDILNALEGNDTVNGDAGDDLILGGLGNDSIDGGLGNDRIDGEAGDDTIVGGDGDDAFALQANLVDAKKFNIYEYFKDDLGTEDESDDIIVAVRDQRTDPENDGFDTLIGIEFLEFGDYKIRALVAALDNALPVLDFAPLADPLSVPQLATRTLSSATLNATDEDNEDTELTYTITDTPDLGNVVLNGTALGVGGTFTQDDINEDRVAYTNTSGAEGAVDTFTFILSDGLAEINTDSGFKPLTVEFVLEPVPTPDAVDDNISANEDSPVTFAAPGILDNDTPDDLSVDQVNGQEVDTGISITFTAGGVATIDPDGEVVFNPSGSTTYNALAVGESTTESFTYTVTDGLGGTDSATATITIDGVNDAPVAGIDILSELDISPIFPGDVLTVSVADLLANDSDPDTSDTLTITDQFTQSEEGIAELADGNVIFTANDDAARGSGTFFYTLSDGNGGTALGAVVFEIGTGEENTAPVAVDDTGETVLENDILTVDAPGVLANDTDQNEGDILTVVEVNGEEANVGVQITLDSGALLTLDSDGGYVYDPNGVFDDSIGDGETATDSFTYTITDDGEPPLTDETPATVTITIDGVTGTLDANAIDDFYTTGEDSPLTVPAPGVLENDQDPDTLSIIEIDGVEFTPGSTVTLSSRALLTLNEDGSFTYDPEVANYEFEGLDEGETGVDIFTYTVDNGNDTDTASVAVTINGSDDLEQRVFTSPKAPKIPTGGGDVDFAVKYDVSVDDKATLRTLGVRLHYNSSLISIDDIAADLTNVFGEPSNFASQQDLADEDDFDADPTTDRFILASWVDLLGGEGELTLYNVNFTPTAAFTEDLSTEINFTASSTAAGFILDAPSITIEFNEAPDAVDDTGATNADAILTVAADSGVLSNDTDPDNPDGGQTLSITQVNGTDVVFDQPITLASGALLTISNNATDGGYIYNPNGAFNDLAEGATGTDSFTYTISDGLGGTDTATVTINVTGGGLRGTYDLDGNGIFDANTDGLFIARALLSAGLNNPVTLADIAFAKDKDGNPDNGLDFIGAGATKTSDEELLAAFQQIDVDADGNGQTDANTDGLFIARVFLSAGIGNTPTLADIAFAADKDGNPDNGRDFIGAGSTRTDQEILDFIGQFVS